MRASMRPRSSGTMLRMSRRRRERSSSSSSSSASFASPLASESSTISLSSSSSRSMRSIRCASESISACILSHCACSSAVSSRFSFSARSSSARDCATSSARCFRSSAILVLIQFPFRWLSDLREPETHSHQPMRRIDATMSLLQHGLCSRSHSYLCLLVRRESHRRHIEQIHILKDAERNAVLRRIPRLFHGHEAKAHPVDVSPTNKLDNLTTSLRVWRVDLNAKALLVLGQAQRTCAHAAKQEVRVMVEQSANVLLLCNRTRERSWLDPLKETANVCLRIEHSGVANYLREDFRRAVSHLDLRRLL